MIELQTGTTKAGPHTAERAYDRTFFESLSRTSEQSARHVVPILMQLLRPRSVVDVGCGAGDWLAEFQRHDIQEILGIDGPWVDRACLKVADSVLVTADLAKPFTAPRQFDLVVSLEVAEHLPPEAADLFVGSLTALGPIVAFSAAAPHQGGTRHLNEQWPDYWIERFSHRHYVVIDAIRPRLWESPEVAWWYAQNLLLFVERDYLAKHPELLATAATPPGTVLPLIHPRRYLMLVEELAMQTRQADLRLRWCSEILAALPYSFARAIQWRARRLMRSDARDGG